MYDDDIMQELVVIEKMLLHIDPDTIRYMGDNVSSVLVDIAARRSGGKYINMLNHLSNVYTATEAYNLMMDVIKQNPTSAPNVIFTAARLCDNEETFTESMRDEIFKECIRRDPSCINCMGIAPAVGERIKDTTLFIRRLLVPTDEMIDLAIENDPSLIQVVPQTMERCMRVCEIAKVDNFSLSWFHDEFITEELVTHALENHQYMNISGRKIPNVTYPIAKVLSSYGILDWICKVPTEEQTFEMIKLVCDNCRYESEWSYYRSIIENNKDKDIRDYIAATDIKMNYEPKE